jgi:hypothetical protein
LLSTTEPRAERGQILVIFAFSLMVIFGIAALVFDGGVMLLEKRTQQNAADAAALAGARFLPGNPGAAQAAAIDLAEKNGFTNGSNGQTVTVNWPPASGPNAGCLGCIEVLIDAEKPSFFAGIWGILSHDVGSRAVGVNEDRIIGPFGLLSLEDAACAALEVGGGGELRSEGDIQVNSSCQPNAMWLRGQGEVVTAPNVGCNVVGGYQQGGNSSSNCPVTSPVPPIPDPYLELDPYEPPIPRDPDTNAIIYPTPPQLLSGSASIPTGCPGADTNPASHESPRLCRFGSALSGTTWRMFPGYYPGGLDFQAGTFYLEPGIYHVAGGGINMNGNGASLTSVDAGGTSLGGGILLFNGRHPTAGAGAIHLNGGSAAKNLWPLQTGTWEGMVIYQSASVCLDVQLNGASSITQVRGTIYVPCGEVVFNGNGGTIITDQVVAQSFKMTGNSGALTIMYDENFVPTFTVAGLIE